MKTTMAIRVVAALVVGLASLNAPVTLAQCTFSSGSTGADGAFEPTNSMPSTGWSVSGNVVTVTNKPDGVFNFTSIDIGASWTVKFTKNTLNTPVWLLATTNVVVAGSIDVSGDAGDVGCDETSGQNGGKGGPGGFDGGRHMVAGNGWGHGPGRGGWVTYWGSGGGSYATRGGGDAAGPTYGVLDVLPLIGGSGGGPNGTGGGGAILIASSGKINVSGAILARGGQHNCSVYGSGGAIRLVAAQIEGEGGLDASGFEHNGRWGGAGRVRLEACSLKRATLTAPPATVGPPGVVFLNPNPGIWVTSIAGTNSPSQPAGSLVTPDIHLPTNFVNPAVISVSASNVPPGTAYKVIFNPVYGDDIVATGTLQGAYAFCTNSVTVNVYTDRVWRVNALIDYIPRP